MSLIVGFSYSVRSHMYCYWNLAKALHLSIMADEKVFVFHNDSLPLQGFNHMEEIRRHGKLCDVTLKVCFLLILLLSIGQ